MTPVSVIGGGGHAKVVIATLLHAGHRVVAVYDDDPRRGGMLVAGVPVVGPVDLYLDRGEGPCCIAIGDNASRARVAARLGAREFITGVHPAAVVHESVDVGVGTVVFAGAVIQPECRIGAHAIINTRASVDHDSTIGDYVHIAPAAALAGGVIVEPGTLVGVGASVLPHVRLGSWAIVGAGAAVIRDVEPGQCVAGVPARLLPDRTVASL